VSRRTSCALGASGLSLLLRRWALDLKMLAPFLFLGGRSQCRGRFMVLIVFVLVLLGIIAHSRWLRTRHGKCEECGKVYTYDEVFKERKLKRVGNRVLCESCSNKIIPTTKILNVDDLQHSSLLREKFESKSGIDALVKKAREYYPREMSKAYPLFKQAILLAPDMETSEILIRGDLTSGGVRESEVPDACWKAWDCYSDIFKSKVEAEEDDNDEDNKEAPNIEVDHEYQELIALIGRKCPRVLEMIEDRKRENKEEDSRRDKFYDVYREVRDMLEVKTADRAVLKEKLNQLEKLPEAEHYWWELRDLGNFIIKQGLDHDIAWSLYNAALYNRMKSGKDLSTVYEPMGFLRKEEGNFFDAAKCFILAYCQASKKTSERQIGICLRKLGVKGNCQEVQDEACKIFSKEGVDAGIRYLKGVSLKKGAI
jgi:hypothetical protein